MAGPDFYTTLGVPRTASPDEIKSPHRELVKKNNPYLFPGDTHKARANNKIQQINEAYATLSNAERRRQYDSRYFQKATVVNPAAAAGGRRSTAGFRRPPTVPVWENLARRADEKLQRIAKSFWALSKTARDYYTDLAQKTRAAKQAAASQTNSSSVQYASATGRVWNFVRRWTRWIL